MKNTIVILERFNNNGKPISVRVWESKWERDCGDIIKFENDKWTVTSTGFHNIDDAIEVKDSKVQHYIKRGWWSGRVKRNCKF